MKENLDNNNEVNKEKSEYTTKSNSDEIKGPKSEKLINMDINNNKLKKDLNYSNPDNMNDWDNADNDW